MMTTILDVSGNQKPVVLVICGPTASGKSAVAIQVAQTIGGEILSADSMQIYRGMDIGTAKVSMEEQKLVPHHLIDLLTPDQPYSVAAWQTAALDTIQQILNRGRVPIVCGGTGQYISALMEGLNFTPVPTDLKLRQALSERADREGYRALIDEIARLDPDTAARLHENDRKRIIRALEVHQLTGLTMTELNRRSRSPELPYRYVGFSLWPERSLLYDRINRRVDAMMAEGLLDEVSRLSLQHLPAAATCRQAIGYKELFAYLDGADGLTQAVERIKQSSRQYAKRQMTWFRRMTQLIPVCESDPAVIAKIILELYSNMAYRQL